MILRSGAENGDWLRVFEVPVPIFDAAGFEPRAEDTGTATKRVQPGASPRFLERIGKEHIMEITYRDDAEFTTEAMIDLYRRSTLGERRPVDRPEIFDQMRRHADLTITAWDGRDLVGIARTLTDYGYAAYLADLAVATSHQRRGIGRRLVAETRARLGHGCMIVLLSAPAAVEYYPKLGFKPHPSAWTLRDL